MGPQCGALTAGLRALQDSKMLMEVLEEKRQVRTEAGKALSKTASFWRCPSPRPLNSSLRPWTTCHQFLSGLPFPVPALPYGTLDLDCSRPTHLSSAAHRPHGPLGSGTGSGCWEPQCPQQAELFSADLRSWWLRRDGATLSAATIKMVTETY